MKFTQLPFANLLGKKGRSAALFLFALLLSLSIFGGSLLLISLRKGLRSLEYRLGADIIVTPSGAFVKKGLESILLYGNRTTFYMPRSRLEETLSVDGVEKASAQVFLATLSSGCCSVGLQIIGFDPASDFTVQPWLTRDFDGVLEKGDVIIGSKILSSVGGTLKFFDVPCKVVAQLGETGTGLDNAVYTSIDTIQDLIDASIRKGVNEKMLKGAGRYISSIMVKAEEGQDLDDLCRRIEHDVKQVKAVRTKSMTSGVSDGLAGVSKVVGVMVGIIWLLCLVVMAVVFSMTIGERKKEFAVLRVMGASRKKVSSLVMREAFFVNAGGCISGIFLALLFALSFHPLIKESLNLPFLLPGVAGMTLLAIFSFVFSMTASLLASCGTAASISKIDTGLILREGT